jgi:hypothetical protein
MSFASSSGPPAPSPPSGLPSSIVDPTDIAALVVMALFAIRRMEVRTTDPRAFPDVKRADFDAWKARALHARNVQVNACFGKFFLNNAWFYGMRSLVSARLLVAGGAVLFFAWLALLAYAWWVSSHANTRAKRLGIVVGRRMVEVPRGEDTNDSDGPNGDGTSAPGAASSR